MAEDSSLENAMSRVLAALAENHAATGSDTWEGKPQQEPLPIAFQPLAAEAGTASEPTIEVVAGDPEDELNQMMSTYVRAVAKLRQAEKSADAVLGNGHVESQSATTGGSKYDQMSLAELMCELDAATE